MLWSESFHVLSLSFIPFSRSLSHWFVDFEKEKRAKRLFLAFRRIDF